MRTIMKFVLASLLGLLLIGCASTTITNLTPTTLLRNANGLYPVEMQMDTSQQTLRTDSVTPMVIVGEESYAMKQTLKTHNRWEALVPIPANVNSLTYKFKVNYLYNRFGKPGAGSKLSDEYHLSIVEK